MSVKPRCPHDHDALKRDPKAWSELRYVGVQPGDGEFPDLELRDCACGSTLSRRIQRA